LTEDLFQPQNVAAETFWTFKDFKAFGNSLAATQILDVKGILR
jgi:hypothetical protein